MVHDISYVKKSWMMKKPLEQNELASSRSGKNHKSPFFAIEFLQQLCPWKYLFFIKKKHVWKTSFVCPFFIGSWFA